MSMDTRNSIIAIIAAGTMAALLVPSLIGILVLAAVHDGELARSALATFNQIIVVVVPAMAALAGVERVVTGLTASKATSSTAAVQVAQVAQGTNGVTPSATSDLAGLTAVETPATVAPSATGDAI